MNHPAPAALKGYDQNRRSPLAAARQSRNPCGAGAGSGAGAGAGAGADTGAAGADVVSRTEAQQRLAGLRTGAGSGTGTAPLRLAEAKKRRHGPR